MFDCVQSDLPEIYWRCTLNDIKVKLRLYLGKHQALIVQEYQTFALLLTQAFGGGGKKNDHNTIRPQSKGELEAAFGSVFS